MTWSFTVFFLRFVFHTDENLLQLFHDRETQNLREKSDAKPKVNSNLAWRASLRNTSKLTTILEIEDSTTV